MDEYIINFFPCLVTGLGMMIEEIIQFAEAVGIVTGLAMNLGKR